MIARPVHRPTPIPFDAPSPKPGASQPRAISWAAASGPAEHPPLHPPLNLQPQPFSVPRLSPVKAPLSPAPLAPARHAAAATLQAAPRPVNATGNESSPANKRASSVKTPYDKSPKLTELSARYIGHGNLSVRSSVTGRHYRFQGHGDSQMVDKHDLMLLKRIADLVIR